MNSPYLVTAVIGAALVLLIIYRQMRTQPVEGRPLVVVPIVLALLGLYSLSNKLPATSAAVSALVASLVLAVVLGLGRGRSMRVWQDAGSGILRQGSLLTAALWLLAIVLRIGIGAFAQRAGVAQSVTVGELPLFLGVTLAAQNLVLWMRAQELAVPVGLRSRRVQ